MQCSTHSPLRFFKYSSSDSALGCFGLDATTAAGAGVDGMTALTSTRPMVMRIDEAVSRESKSLADAGNGTAVTPGLTITALPLERGSVLLDSAGAVDESAWIRLSMIFVSTTCATNGSGQV